MPDTAQGEIHERQQDVWELQEQMRRGIEALRRWKRTTTGHEKPDDQGLQGPDVVFLPGFTGWGTAGLVDPGTGNGEGG